jgi:predicted nucleotidyltransferase
MDRDEVLRLLAAHRREIDQYGVRRLALFGSMARGDARSDSDVDLLVDFDGRATFDRYMGLKLLLEDVLRRRVDLVTERSLKPPLRPYVEADAVNVA